MSAERKNMSRRRPLNARTVLIKFLLGEEDVSFRAGFLSFCTLTYQMISEDQRPPKTLTSTATSTTDLPHQIPIPKSVLVLHRKKNISNYRRRGTRVILGKVLAALDFASMEGWEDVWKSRHSEGEPEFLKTVETLEQEIFECSNELTDYENLLLNVVTCITNQKRSEELRSSVSNASSQTEDSFLSGRHKSVEELLVNRQKDFTEEEWAVLVEQNRLVESEARSRWSQGLRHSFTQTLASLHSGLKCVESDSSPEFDWLELAPDPIRFFPVFPAGTQTTDVKRRDRQQLVWSGMVQRLPVNPTKIIAPFFEFCLPKLGPEEEPWDLFVARSFPKGLGVDLKDVSVGVQIGRLLPVLDDIVPTCCLTHKGPKPKPGCLPCKAALWMPPPWAHPLFALMYEAYCMKHCPTENEIISGYVIKNFQDEEQMVLSTGIRCEALSNFHLHPSQCKCYFPPEYVLKHLSRKFFYSDTLLFRLKKSRDKREQARETKKLKETTLDCACLPPKREVGSSHAVLPNEGAEHDNKGHYCLFCGVREKELGIKFQVCWECRRQRLFIKAFYCSTDCLLKHRHEHRKLHDAFAPGKIDHRDLSSLILFPRKKK